MSAFKPPSPQDIPVLRDVVVPGQRAARGQTTRNEPRASDFEPPAEEEINEEEIHEEEIDDSAIYNSLLEPGLNSLDIEGVIDRVLDKHAPAVRDELREEFERLLERAQKNR